MKKWSWCLPALLLACSFTACSQAENGGVEMPENPRILIVYYSLTNNTHEIAGLIQQNVGGDLVRLETADPYPDEYRDLTAQAKREIESGYLPPLTTEIEDIAQYDLIFVGSPNWWSTIAPPVMTFLSEYDLAGKTVVPFVTHGGGGMARCAAEIGRRCPDSALLAGKAFRDNGGRDAARDVTAWLREIELVR